MTSMINLSLFRSLMVAGLFFCFAQAKGQSLFRELPAAKSGVEFSNPVVEDSLHNPFFYYNVYNGGGVAGGDINNDGLPDLYFSGNQVPNRLYLNEGGLKFRDITKKSGTGGHGGWATGVTLADVNADGFLDIYVCQAGSYRDTERLKNQLFLNNGDLTFTESAGEWGIADIGRSVDATFFDYDKDGDLDLYVVNHPDDFNLPLAQRVQAERNPYHKESDHLYRNEGDHFLDVTIESGVSNWAFGLSVIASDLNQDGWTDLFVGCDYSEPDYYWLNQGDGTFKNNALGAFQHISNFSMGSDVGDINNDGLPDLMVLDMMAKDNRRKKTNMSGMNPKAFWDNVRLGRHYQYMQNVLQLNNGLGTFSEIAELSGVSTTDWSWSPLLADLDNDGYQDLFVSNGLKRDLRNNDYSKSLLGRNLDDFRTHYKEFAAQMPSEKIANFGYRNEGDLTFSDQSRSWGLDHLGFSTGAAVADLDRDGDLDIVLNNVDERGSILENTLSGAPFLQVLAKGSASNPFAYGLKVTLHSSVGKQYRELTVSRGYQSSSEPLVHFGLPKGAELYYLELTWPDGKVSKVRDLPASGRIEVSYEEAGPQRAFPPDNEPWLQPFSKDFLQQFRHQDLPFDDYRREVLLPHTYSQNGPLLASGDINGDGLADLWVGGAMKQSGVIFAQDRFGQFQKIAAPALAGHAEREDMGGLFFDADGDGDEDLYVVSGSNEWEEGDRYYQDRLYLNEGKGSFIDGSDRLPDLRFSGSRVAASDVDGDGDLDLFVGGRSRPGHYPFPGKSALLLNKKGRFVDATSTHAPELEAAGMVTDALWMDVDQDGDPDLILSGEWMPLTLYLNQEGKLYPAPSGLEDKVGWWYRLHAADLDGDGDLDLIGGNLGLNTKYRGSDSEPFEVYGNDFDGNGQTDIVLGYHQDGTTYPVRGRQCSSEQLPYIKKEFPTYQEFGNASLVDILGGDLDKSLHYSANWMQTSWAENMGNGKFQMHALPNEAQVSAVQGIAVHDVNRDGHLDIILAGNMFNAEVETCRHDASIGLVLAGDGKGNFTPISVEQSGFFAAGDIKDLQMIPLANGGTLLVYSRNNHYWGAHYLAPAR